MFNYNQLGSFLGSSPLSIAIVGAGGKTSTMFGLGRFFSSQKRRVLLTTTTKILAPKAEECTTFHVGKIENNLSIAPGEIHVFGASVNEAQKVTGYSPDILEKLNYKKFDVLIYEADGAKRMPFKAPNKTEPCLAKNSTHVIGCIGLDSLGEILNEKIAFRLEQIQMVTGCRIGEKIELKHVIKLVQSPNGLFQYAPSGAKKICVLTKADNSVRRKDAACIQKILQEQEWEGTVFWL